MVNTTCLSPSEPDALYSYCPSFPAATLFAVLFALTTLIHTTLGLYHRKPFTLVLTMGALWETAGYVARTISITSQTSAALYSTQQLLILLAPLWINAYIYMLLGRLIHYFLASNSVFGIRARRITVMFVLFDVTAFLVQAAGGSMTSGSDIPPETVRVGLNVYTGGVGLQLAFIAVFCCLAARFTMDLKRQDGEMARRIALEMVRPDEDTHCASAVTEDQEVDYSARTYRAAFPLLVTIWTALGLIVVRNIYRLVEFGIGGVNGNTITNHEWWMYVFDAVPVFAAFIVLAAYHVGRVLKGPKSDFRLEDKRRKEEKNARKTEKKDAKNARKQEKKDAKYAKVKSAGGSQEELV